MRHNKVNLVWPFVFPEIVLKTKHGRNTYKAILVFISRFDYRCDVGFISEAVRQAKT